MKKFTKGQKIFLIVFTMVYLALFFSFSYLYTSKMGYPTPTTMVFPSGEPTLMSEAAGQIARVLEIPITVASNFGNVVIVAFGGAPSSFFPFCSIYSYLLWQIFVIFFFVAILVILYKKIRNR